MTEGKFKFDLFLSAKLLFGARVHMIAYVFFFFGILTTEEEYIL